MNIKVKNKRAHRAAKMRPEVQKCYQIIDNANKTATWDNTGYKIERRILGDRFMDDVLAKVQEIEKKQDKVISGHEIMQITGITAGPSIGRIIKYIQDNGLSREEAHKYLKGVSK